MQKISGTLFESLYDVKTNKTITLDSFDKFEEVLYRLSKKPRKDKCHLLNP